MFGRVPLVAYWVLIAGMVRVTGTIITATWPSCQSAVDGHMLYQGQKQPSHVVTVVCVLFKAPLCEKMNKVDLSLGLMQGYLGPRLTD